MADKVFYALYDDDDILMDAAKKLVAKGVHVNDVFSPFPLHGIDPIIGLVPFIGDMVTYVFSALLIFQTLKSKPSPMLVTKMFMNITLDAVVGAIPILGSIFDFIYKANERNYRLLVEYKSSDKHRESVLPYFLGMLIFSILLVFIALWLSYALFNYLFDLL